MMYSTYADKDAALGKKWSYRCYRNEMIKAVQSGSWYKDGQESQIP